MFSITPFERGRDLFDAFERDFFGASQRLAGIRTDIRDEGDKFVLEAELPGFDKDDIKLDITGDCLTLAAERTNADDGSSDGSDSKRYIRRERIISTIKRSFDISGINKDAIDAQYKNGVLYLDLPKQQPQAPSTRRLEIKGC